MSFYMSCDLSSAWHSRETREISKYSCLLQFSKDFFDCLLCACIVYKSFHLVHRTILRDSSLTILLLRELKLGALRK